MKLERNEIEMERSCTAHKHTSPENESPSMNLLSLYLPRSTWARTKQKATKVNNIVTIDTKD